MHYVKNATGICHSPLTHYRLSEKSRKKQKKKGTGCVTYFHLDEYPGPEENSWNKRYL